VILKKKANKPEQVYLLVFNGYDFSVADFIICFENLNNLQKD